MSSKLFCYSKIKDEVIDFICGQRFDLAPNAVNPFFKRQMCNNVYCFTFQMLCKRLGVPLAKHVMQFQRQDWQKYLRRSTFTEFRQHMGPFRGKKLFIFTESSALYQLREFAEEIQGHSKYFSMAVQTSNESRLGTPDFVFFAACCDWPCGWEFWISTATGQVAVAPHRGADFTQHFDSLYHFILYWLDQTPNEPIRWCRLWNPQV